MSLPLTITHSYNRIVIVQSLGGSDRPTGQELSRTLSGYLKATGSQLELDYFEPGTAAELRNLLRALAGEAGANGRWPILHLEMHGSPEGVSLASGEIVLWPELRDMLVPLNAATRLNLLVVMASCYGALFMKGADATGRAPFWAVIGPPQEAVEAQIENAFQRFYLTLLGPRDGTDAMDALNAGERPDDAPFYFLSASYLFHLIWSEYARTSLIEPALTERVDKIVAEVAARQGAHPSSAKPWLRNAYRDHLLNVKPRFEEFRARFFMADLFPENSERFAVTLDRAS